MGARDTEIDDLPLTWRVKDHVSVAIGCLLRVCVETGVL
jgi:hypothetical protein